ncbi:MAG: phage baseplate protein [Paraclostridium sp.]
MIKLLCFEEEYKPSDIPAFTIWLQVVTRFSTDYKNRVTKRRIERGFNITDNSSNEPISISINGSFGDIIRNPDNSFTGLYALPILGHTNNKMILEEVKMNLERIRDEKMFIVVYNMKTGKFYDNYLVTSITISDSPKTKNGFDFSLTLQEAKIGEVGEISVTTENAPATDGNKGQGNLDGSVSDSTKNRTSMALDGFRAVGKAVGSLGG